MQKLTAWFLLLIGQYLKNYNSFDVHLLGLGCMDIGNISKENL
jgi:hypothetical protein